MRSFLVLLRRKVSYIFLRLDWYVGLLSLWAVLLLAGLPVFAWLGVSVLVVLRSVCNQYTLGLARKFRLGLVSEARRNRAIYAQDYAEQGVALVVALGALLVHNGWFFSVCI